MAVNQPDVDILALEWEFKPISLSLSGGEIDIKNPDHKAAFDAFKDFLVGEHSGENLEFISLMKEWHDKKTVSLGDITKMINAFIREGGNRPGKKQKNENDIGSKSINISAQARQEILKAFDQYQKSVDAGQPDPELLNMALKKVQVAMDQVIALVQRDSLGRFKQTKEYQALPVAKEVAKKEAESDKAAEKAAKKAAKAKKAEQEAAAKAAKEAAMAQNSGTEEAKDIREKQQIKDVAKSELLKKVTNFALFKKQYPNDTITLVNLQAIQNKMQEVKEVLDAIKTIPPEKQDKELLHKMQRAQSDWSTANKLCRQELTETGQKAITTLINEYEERHNPVIKEAKKIVQPTEEPVSHNLSFQSRGRGYAVTEKQTPEVKADVNPAQGSQTERPKRSPNV